MAATEFETRAGRKYTGEFLGAMALYLVLFFLRDKFLPGTEDFAFRMMLSLLPMIGVALATWAIARHLLRVDEMQRLRLLEIMVWSAAVTALAAIAYSFLETGLGFPRLSMAIVWIVMAFSWLFFSVLYHALGRVSWSWPWTTK